MRFVETLLAGAFLVEPEPRADARGFFARTFCAAEFAERGLASAFVQSNVSFNHAAGTLRGMHYQLPPSAETKLVRCTSGAVYDVIVDLRPGSPTYLRHFGVELTAANRRALYVPAMFAHGYETLSDGAEVVYQVDAFYAPDCERGLRHDDPALGIRWPLPVRVISEKDQSWPTFS
ncbi:MAG TPA: dTDP-4-dehydrorhamnose 3,5-epimerase [Thermoanaerobaculia bacterium]|nr:dTDP-4-dehydrorhamnose 3,5-epimerase [Thermoanaerobaculia bacterium]